MEVEVEMDADADADAWQQSMATAAGDDASGSAGSAGAPRVTCGACNKSYSSSSALRKHMQRQPMCEAWLKLRPGIKNYVDDKLATSQQAKAELHDDKDRPRTCSVCNASFVNQGNLNRHLDGSLACQKWTLYNDLAWIESYVTEAEHETEAETEAEHETLQVDRCSRSRRLGLGHSHVPASSGVPRCIHIIWNLLLADKGILGGLGDDGVASMLAEENITYVIAILPAESAAQIYEEHLGARHPGLAHGILPYEGHEPRVDKEAFDVQCRKIEEIRDRTRELGASSPRANVLIFCNSGYQRSIPFICYYLTRFHADEAPSIDKAVDLVLPNVDRAAYAAERGRYVTSITDLLAPEGPGGVKAI